jgi:hypothetical protein
MAENEQNIIKKVSFWEFLQGLMKKKPAQNDAAKKESASVRALKKHISTLEEVVDSQDELLRAYSKELRLTKEGNIQEKLIDAAINIFSPKEIISTNVNPPVNNAQQKLDTGIKYSDEQLSSILNSLPANVKKTLNSMPVQAVQTTLKNKGLNVNESTIKRAKEMLKNER